MSINVYETGLGDELVNPGNYDDQIRYYLDEESKLLNNLFPIFDTLIEVGCMSGRYVNDALGHEKRYIGVDEIRRYIDDAEELFSGHIKDGIIKFICDTFDNLADSFSTDVDPFRTLVFFPFNSFGNTKDVTKSIDLLSSLFPNFIIFTYGTDQSTNNIRRDYYARSGFTRLEKIIDERGVVFKSDEGLFSTAYSNSWISSEFRKRGVKLADETVGRIGKAYLRLAVEMKPNP